jgi:hypothetical protein
MPPAEPGERGARLVVDAELSGPWTAWPAELSIDQRVYLHLGLGTYLRWQRA